ncbi:MAG: hypothetical protein ACOY40_08400 [Bacillota bacterium]
MVEVLSPSTEKCDRKEKSGMYFERCDYTPRKNNTGLPGVLIS